MLYDYITETEHHHGEPTNTSTTDISDTWVHSERKYMCIRHGHNHLEDKHK